MPPFHYDHADPESENLPHHGPFVDDLHVLRDS